MGKYQNDIIVMNASITEYYHRLWLYLVATLRTPGQQGDADVLDDGGVAVGLLDDLLLDC